MIQTLVHGSDRTSAGIFSKASFDSPYGLIGRAGVVSSIGTRSGRPKIAQVEEKTISLNASCDHGIEQIQPVANVVAKILRRNCALIPRRARLAAKCITAFRARTGQRSLDVRAVGQLALNEVSA